MMKTSVKTIVKHSLQLALSAMLITAPSTLAAEAHVHGSGQLLITQDAQDVTIRFILPAADLYGFEHKAATPEQKQKVAQVKQTFEHISKAIELSGKCTTTSGKVSVSAAHEDHDDDDEDEDHDEHEHHGEEHHHHHHENIQLDYQLNCTTDVSDIKVTLFAAAPTLQHIEAQWINAKGQGMQKLSPEHNAIHW
ncbi:ZrgA family zinc uptake protein [Neptunicella marina]|uniref:DUF2796 domain-containing protein n=1 Tax=Neptunicella marina TaxID=2125989 RepID=A0A8J6IT23_9ALTE|nr:DUF2796 domain-containing protein [Neptunicella marina]MBC3765222.1 DUF2796 domain-containing protein [Neptunicella marina]